MTDPNNLPLQDSGTRRTFETGAQRDRAKGKGRYDLISPIAIHRLATVLEKGAEKYAARNWEKGMHLSNYIDSAQRHLYNYLEGKRDEDHMGQAFWNIMAFIHTEEMISRGQLPADLNDIPQPSTLSSPTQEVVASIHSQGVKNLRESMDRAMAKLPTYGPNQDFDEDFQLPPSVCGIGGCVLQDFKGAVEDALSDERVLETLRLMDQHSPWVHFEELVKDQQPASKGVIYVAGPMRGLPKANFPAFDAATAYLRAHGWHPINPADLDREELGLAPFAYLSESQVKALDIREVMRRDTAAILDADAIALLPGWGNSAGVSAELPLAKLIGCEIVELTQSQLEEGQRLLLAQHQTAVENF